MPSNPPHAAYRRAAEASDLAAVAASLAPGVVLNSPITPKPFEGREQVTGVLSAVFEVLGGLTFVDSLVGDDRTSGLIFRARIGDRELQGIDYLRFDGDGLIDDFTVMIRPLSGVVALQNEMAPRMGAQPLTLEPVV